ncbi:hypothetical protein H0H87_006719 [Tephrocybe sp. NHM501043]|nr:hypothetical protein H0H87_006719 [Tephrocybe sp. NHM501043]
MFANPISRAILQSSGAIPVKRNPNNGNGKGNGNGSSTSPQANLFRESSMALAAGKVIGAFPEGTSYTQPSIMQVMSGVAWAAMDYVKWVDEQEVKSPPLTIVPVRSLHHCQRAAPYNDLRYGKPILVDSYTKGMFEEGANVEASTRVAVKKITAEIEKQMRAMSVNAPDWDTLYAAQMARDIIYEDPANIPIKNWVSVSQSLVDIFTSQPVASANLEAAKSSLKTYYALLHHTGISHSSLTALLPSRPGLLPIRILRAAVKIPIALMNFLLFVPPMVLYIPAYISGNIASRSLVEEGEVEGEAQYKAIFGGVGLGVGLATAFGVLQKTLGLDSLRDFIAGGVAQDGVAGRIRRLVGAFGVVFGSVYLLVKWHNALVYERYTHPPEPPPNPFIKRNKETYGAMAGNVNSPAREIPTTIGMPKRKLIRPLLAARKEAISALEAYLMTRMVEGVGKAEFLSKMNNMK